MTGKVNMTFLEDGIQVETKVSVSGGSKGLNDKINAISSLMQALRMDDMEAMLAMAALAEFVHEHGMAPKEGEVETEHEMFTKVPNTELGRKIVQGLMEAED